MKPQHTLGLITTPDGSEFVLHERDGAYSIRVNGRDLMTSRAHGSEKALARLVLSRFGDRLEIIVEHELTARNAAIDVVSGSGEKQARMSGHGISPMRGRDNHLLLSHFHNSTIRYVAPMLRRSWAQLIKRVFEVDPLVCSSCGGEMRITAFIVDHDVVDAILRPLAKAEERSRRGPPRTAALSATC